jgi:hypothetical protein
MKVTEPYNGVLVFSPEVSPKEIFEAMSWCEYMKIDKPECSQVLMGIF